MRLSSTRCGSRRLLAALTLLLVLGVLCRAGGSSAQAPAAKEAYAEAQGAYAEGFRAFEAGDPGAALRLWTPLAESGDARAQFGIGLIYEAGLGGVPQDEEAALGWYRRAARGGLSAAQNNLALMYAEGRVAPRDPETAATLWREAAAAGYRPAQLNLALALERGEGVERNQAEAAAWRERARAQELAAAGEEGARAAEAPDAFVPSEPLSPPARAPAPEAPPTPAPEAPPAADGFYVQLASFPERESAERFGAEAARLHADLLSRWPPVVRAADLGGKGVWHRVLFGPLPAREPAARLCEEIHARTGDCVVAPARSLDAAD